jgi:lipopolysaccharide transport system ATP-binding protein
MPTPIVSIENLSKSYRLGHRARAHEARGQATFRDAIVRSLHNAARKAGDVLHGRQVIQGDEVEEFWALRDISFDVHEGEVVGIIGRNGAGKSTLLKILSRITEPTTGRVTLHGRVSSLLEVGTGFHPELSGRENIYLNGAVLGMTRAEVRRKFDEIIEFSGVERFLDTPVKRYSSGMYVRLAFAVAAHLDPEILIVDEVLAVGDAEFQRKCLGKMDEVARRAGRTVLVVSHNMATVKSLCSRAIWLENGTVREMGEPLDLTSRYLARGTTGLERVIPLDRYERPVWVKDDRLRFTALEWLSPLPLRHGEPVAVRIHFETRAPVSGVGVLIGFISVEGARVLSYHMDRAEARRDLTRPGRYAVDLIIASLDLGPSAYGINVSCRSGDSHTLDSVAGAGQVEVVPGPNSPAILGSNASGVQFEGQWKWEKTELGSQIGATL